jgi:hypothetical protein
MQKILRQNATSTSGIGTAEPILPTPDEIRPSQTKLLNADLAPLATRELMALIGGARASEHLRLNVPQSANPFQHSPSGQKHDYFILRDLVARSKRSLETNAIVTLLEQTPVGISEEEANFMRASLAREYNMLDLVQEVVQSVGHIHTRIVGSQEG